MSFYQKSLFFLFYFEGTQYLLLRQTFLYFFFSPLSIVSVNVAVLAHPICIKFIVGTVPRLFCSTVLVIAVVAHSFCIVLTILMATVVHFLAKCIKIYIFFLWDFTSVWGTASYCLDSPPICSMFYSFFERSWMLRCMYWFISCCCFVKSSTWFPPSCSG